MTRGIPATLTRAAFVDTRTGFLTREGMLFLESLRSSVGGDSATVTPSEPVGSLTPMAALGAVSGVFFDPLAPVSVSGAAPDLAPLSVATLEVLI